jgi:hypothetical protein
VGDAKERAVAREAEWRDGFRHRTIIYIRR